MLLGNLGMVIGVYGTVVRYRLVLWDPLRFKKRKIQCLRLAGAHRARREVARIVGLRSWFENQALPPKGNNERSGELSVV